MPSSATDQRWWSEPAPDWLLQCRRRRWDSALCCWALFPAVISATTKAIWNARVALCPSYSDCWCCCCCCCCYCRCCCCCCHRCWPWRIVLPAPYCWYHPHSSPKPINDVFQLSPAAYSGLNGFFLFTSSARSWRSYSNSWPRKLKFGDMVVLFDLTYLFNRNSNQSS